jgi:hypothetical protein
MHSGYPRLNITLPEEADDRNLAIQVVGTILATEQPLSLTSSVNCTLLNTDNGDARGSIPTLLENLGCAPILCRILGKAVVVRIGHPSFGDYVTS